MKRTQRPTNNSAKRRNAWHATPSKKSKQPKNCEKTRIFSSPNPSRINTPSSPPNIKEKHKITKMASNSRFTETNTPSPPPKKPVTPSSTSRPKGRRRQPIWDRPAAVAVSQLPSPGITENDELNTVNQKQGGYSVDASSSSKTKQPSKHLSIAPEKEELASLIVKQHREGNDSEVEAVHREEETEEGPILIEEDGESEDGENTESLSEPEFVDGHLTKQQAYILKKVLKGENVFFTGSAGTGKSFLLREIIDALNNLPDCGAGVYVTASTGTAAVHIGGCTLHSFAGIGLGNQTVTKLVHKIRTDPRCKGAKRRWKMARILIIDEISMLDAGLFDKLEHMARILRDDDSPFGGIQLVLCGDFLQLPPVRKRDDPEAKLFLFQAQCWDRVIDTTFILEHIFRQHKDKRFAKILNEIRLGYVSPSGEKLLERCTVPFEKRKNRTKENIDNDKIKPTMLYALRKDVYHENHTQLSILDSKEHTFAAADSGDNTLLKQLQSHCTAPETLKLKVGAQVVLLKNLDFARKLVNGSRGVVVDFVWNTSCSANDERIPTTAFAPVVEFTNGIRRTLSKEVWTVKMDSKRSATRVQYPLALAWALTIHKAQGMTLSKVQMKLSQVWETGQAYVALSRATSESGLYLIDYDPHKIKANDTVLRYYKKILCFQPSMNK